MFLCFWVKSQKCLLTGDELRRKVQIKEMIGLGSRGAVYAWIDWEGVDPASGTQNMIRITPYQIYT